MPQQWLYVPPDVHLVAFKSPGSDRRLRHFFEPLIQEVTERQTPRVGEFFEIVGSHRGRKLSPDLLTSLAVER